MIEAALMRILFHTIAAILFIFSLPNMPAGFIPVAILFWAAVWFTRQEIVADFRMLRAYPHRFSDLDRFLKENHGR